MRLFNLRISSFIFLGYFTTSVALALFRINSNRYSMRFKAGLVNMRMEATPLGAEPAGLSLPRGAVSVQAHYSDHASRGLYVKGISRGLYVMGIPKAICYVLWVYPKAICYVLWVYPRLCVMCYGYTQGYMICVMDVMCYGYTVLTTPRWLQPSGWCVVKLVSKVLTRPYILGLPHSWPLMNSQHRDKVKNLGLSRIFRDSWEICYWSHGDICWAGLHAHGLIPASLHTGMQWQRYTPNNGHVVTSHFNLSIIDTAS